MSIAAVVLAAGEASRFGTPKQRLLLPEVLERLEQSPVDDIVVVAGAHTLETPARVVTCAGWKRGPGASLSSGLEELGDDVEAAIVVLADGPDLDAGGGRARDRLAGGPRAASVVAASYGGERGHPLLHRPRGLGRRFPTRVCASSRRGSCRATISAIPATWTRRPICRRACASRLSVRRRQAPAERSWLSLSIRPAGIRSTAVVCTYWRSDTSKR